MCTAITFKTMDDFNFLARTMDFSFQLDAEPVYIPKNYTFNSHVKDEHFKSKYSFIGAGRDMHGYLFADGLNEQGFGIATLYFEENAKFSSRKNSKKLNIASDELVSWALGNISSVKEFENKIIDLNIMGVKNEILGKILPLHWIISDKTGETKCLEITSDGVNLYENKVGVMTNSPKFPWHLTNLGHFNGLQPNEPSEKQYGDFKTVSDGPGIGLMGMPGDYTSASRFIRAAVLKQYTSGINGPEKGLNAVIHILNSVDIPKGVKITDTKKNISDFTQYKGIMNLTSLTYYMLSYDSFFPHKVTLDEEMMKKNEPVVIPIVPDYQILDSFDTLNKLVPNGVDWANLKTIISTSKK